MLSQVASIIKDITNTNDSKISVFGENEVKKLF